MHKSTKPPPGSKNIQLIAAMDNAGVIQDELARLTNLDPATISKLVVGRRRPRSRTAAVIAEILNVSVEEIFPNVWR